jgi:thiamine-monophosphate kinase
VGLARAGRLALGRKRRGRQSRALATCVRAFAEPAALLAEGRSLVGRARAALDVSDGLSGDAGQLARASGVRVVIDRALLSAALAPELVEASRELGEDPLELALRGGEDYALLAAGPRARRPRKARVIGRIERGRGVVLEGEERARALRSGFDHFA